MADRVVVRGKYVDLYVRFTDTSMEPVNPDDTPQVEITDSGGTIRRVLSDSGISLVDDPGLYKLSYEVEDTFADGYATDRWVADIGGTEVESSFSFLVLTSGSINKTVKPEFNPGDTYNFDFSQEEVAGINRLLPIIKARLKSDGTARVPDGNGGFRDQVCNVFSDNELILFLVNSLSEFNQQPHFTNYSFADTIISTMFMDVIVQGAVLLGMAAQALIERGREFNITDQGISFQPPTVSELLNNQFSAQLAVYRTKLKEIKINLKPQILGLGTLRISAISPSYRRLRHLRQKQIL